MSGADLVDVEGAADYLDVGERMIRRLVAERRVAFVHVGRHVRFTRADLDSYIFENRVEAVTARSRPATTSNMTKRRPRKADAPSPTTRPQGCSPRVESPKL
jgi:excisionase family DNA binding protein